MDSCEGYSIFMKGAVGEVQSSNEDHFTHAKHWEKLELDMSNTASGLKISNTAFETGQRDTLGAG